QVGKLQRVQFGGESMPPQRYRLRRPPLQSAQYPSGAGTATMDGHLVNHWVYQRYDSDWKGYFPLLTAQKKQARQSRQNCRRPRLNSRIEISKSFGECDGPSDASGFPTELLRNRSAKRIEPGIRQPDQECGHDDH